jgi:hypothetical protein
VAFQKATFFVTSITDAGKTCWKKGILRLRWWGYALVLLGDTF